MRRTVWECHLQLEQATLPNGLVFAWYRAFPLLQIEGTLKVLGRSCDESEWVAAAPLFAGGDISSCAEEYDRKDTYRSSCSREIVNDIVSVVGMRVSRVVRECSKRERLLWKDVGVEGYWLKKGGRFSAACYRRVTMTVPVPGRY